MKINPHEFQPARPHAHLTTGEMIRILRQKKGWTQVELAKRSGIHANNLSLLEKNRIDIGKRRALQLAKTFGVHPATIMFPEYENRETHKAA